MTNRKEPLQGTDNVLVELGFDDAPELTAKAALALKLNDLIDKRGLSQIETAAITGMTQPKVSQVRRYKLQNISLERLMQALVSLDQHVEIDAGHVIDHQAVQAWADSLDTDAPLPTPGMTQLQAIRKRSGRQSKKR